MSRSIQVFRKLLVISDTGIYEVGLNEFMAFGPVVKELDYFLEEFSQVTWIGYNRPDQINNKSYRLVNKKIDVILLNRIGGKSLYSKLLIILNYPIMLFKIIREINKNKYIHIRSPSHPAFITMLLSFFYPNKIFWFKYAGSWIDKAPFFYNFQRCILKKLNKNSKITVNGKWSSNSQIYCFENPCLSIEERHQGEIVARDKIFPEELVFCFVGALNRNKGVDLILEALAVLNNDPRIKEFHFVGDGHERKEFEKIAQKLSVNIIFHGFLNKESIVEIYTKSHFILLPSKSEGFPKVIGEAINYGCIPIVTNVSSIGQYIEDGINGFLIEQLNAKNLIETMKKALKYESIDLKGIQKNNNNFTINFTYEHYLDRVVSEIFNLN